MKNTSYIVPNAYFTKVTFGESALELGLHVTSRLQDDVSLRYLTVELSLGGRRCSNQYNGKINMKKPDGSRFEMANLGNGKGRILSTVVNSIFLKRNVCLYIWENENGKFDREKSRKLWETGIKFAAIAA